MDNEDIADDIAHGEYQRGTEAFERLSEAIKEALDEAERRGLERAAGLVDIERQRHNPRTVEWERLSVLFASIRALAKP